jgi:flavin reductase (DIM6/NTAB) family NADH-FMN oxidoreductase RutF/rubredoxin
MNFEAFFKISYGLYIVSSKSGEKMNGYISNSVFQVTAEPPRIAVTCSKDNFTAEIIKKSQAFSISVLSEKAGMDIVGTFGYKSGKDTDKFKEIAWSEGETGVPVVTEDSIASFECKVIQAFDVGTHIIFIGEVISADLLEGDENPMTYAYYRYVKKGVAPKNAPTYIDKSKLATKKEAEPAGKKYECQVCAHVYDPAIGDEAGGIPAGTPFEDIPENWICPVCGTRKSDFTEIS